MANRQIVACPAGHGISTRLRGRSTTCGQCGQRVYVRADGTTRHKLSGQPGRRAPGETARRARRAGRADAGEYDERREIGHPVDLIDAAEYDKGSDRTRLFDVEGNEIGWTSGDVENGDWPDGWGPG